MTARESEPAGRRAWQRYVEYQQNKVNGSLLPYLPASARLSLRSVRKSSLRRGGLPYMSTPMR
jgi:hypothetical protein